jgi:hypothetical protein
MTLNHLASSKEAGNLRSVSRTWASPFRGLPPGSLRAHTSTLITLRTSSTQRARQILVFKSLCSISMRDITQYTCSTTANSCNYSCSERCFHPLSPVESCVDTCGLAHGSAPYFSRRICYATRKVTHSRRESCARASTRHASWPASTRQNFSSAISALAA